MYHILLPSCKKSKKYPIITFEHDEQLNPENKHMIPMKSPMKNRWVPRQLHVLRRAPQEARQRLVQSHSAGVENQENSMEISPWKCTH